MFRRSSEVHKMPFCFRPSAHRLQSPTTSTAIAVLLLLIGSLAAAPASSQGPPEPLAKHLGGEWTDDVIPFPHVSVSMANLPDGRILSYASNERDRFPGNRPEFTYAAVWDPSDGSFLEIPHPNHDMFCASLVMLEDGSVFITGGRNQADSPWVSIYDYFNNAWVMLENMNQGRWYPTSVAMATGQVIIAGGIGGGNHPEIWTPGAGWQLLTGIDINDSIAENVGLRDGGGLWPLLQLDPRGEIFHAGAVPEMHSFDPTGLGSTTDLGPHGAGWFPDEGTSVLYDEGKLLVSGGSLSTATNASSKESMVIDINSATPVVSATGDMVHARQFHNEIMLPTGEVLVVGGNTDGVKFNDDNAVLAPEVWDPTTGTWREMNPQIEARTYHSVASLLVDGTVLSAGGGLSGNDETNHWNGEIFRPHYLYAADDSPAVRPVIDDSPGVIRIGSTFEVQATAGLAGFSLVKMSATTHTMNTDLRFLRPSSVETSPGVYEITLRSNPNVLTPGYWMLFAMAGDLGSDGVPSEGRIVQLVTTGEPRGKPLADRSGQVGDPVLLTFEAEDPDGNPVTFTAGGLPPGLVLDGDGRLHGTLEQVGIYNVGITVDDGTETSVVNFLWYVSLADAEVGTLTVSQADADTWHTVDLVDFYQEPVVVMGPPSFADAEPTTVRVRNVTTNSFEFQLDEWDYLDGAHASETLSYLVVEAGAHQRTDGGAIVAGRSGGVNTPWRSVLYPENAFSTPPVVLTQVATADEADALTVRQRNGDALGFEMQLERQQAGGQVFDDDEVHWIAIEPGVVAGLLEAANTGAIVDHNGETLSYQAGFSGPPHFLAGIETNNGGDTVALRHDNASASNVEVFLEEEQSGDSETGHGDESVAWLAIDPATSAIALSPLFNSPPGFLDPGPQFDLIDDSVSLEVQVFDDDGDVPSFSAMGLPTGLTIDPQSGTVTGTPTALGVFDVTLVVTDPAGGQGEASFPWTISESLVLTPFATPPAETDATIVYTAPTNLAGPQEFVWDFGDGSGVTPASSDPMTSHSFAAPGRYIVTLWATDVQTGSADMLQFVQMIHAPLAPQRPTASSQIAYESAAGGGVDRVWAVNPDNDSVTYVDATLDVKLGEIAVAANPRSVAIAGDGRIWVVCKEAAQIDVIDPAQLEVVAQIPLPRGSRPHGLAFDPSGANAFVVLEAIGEVWRLDGVSAALQASRAVGPRVRHVAVDPDGATLLVSRFVTPPLPGEATGVVETEIDGQAVGGEVLKLDATTLDLEATIVIHHGEDVITEFSAPGIPNYLGAAAISPDRSQAWVPAKQDNIKGGLARSGLALAHDSTVRAITSRIDLATSTEDEAARIDHDDASVASASLFGSFGAYLFTALEGNREIAVSDAHSKFQLGRFPAGRAVQALALSPDGRTLYAHNFMDRTISVHDLADLIDFDDVDVPTRATIALVETEALAPDVLLGKQHFYDAQDERLAKQGYMACAACHNAAGGDGRVWDFTQFGEGLRNTTDLQGRGVGHGRVHWTSNFDEVQDFEGQIRGFALGLGLMDDADFEFEDRSEPFGLPKAGLSTDLDALAAYVASLVQAGDSPHRAADGSFTPEAIAGRDVFAASTCAACHLGAAFSNSESGTRSSIGSHQPLSGADGGFDTPTLRGLWWNAPYLHDGSAATLEDAILAHTDVIIDPLGDLERAQLVAYLEQVDDAEPVAPEYLPEPAFGSGALLATFLLGRLGRREPHSRGRGDEVEARRI